MYIGLMPKCEKCGFETSNKGNIKQHKNSPTCIYKDEIIQKYRSGQTSEEIADQLPLGSASICNVLRRNGELRTQSESRERAWQIGKFDSRRPDIDYFPTEDFAWLLSTLYCDGSVFVTESNSNYKITLQVTDFEFSRRFEEVLEGIGFNTYTYIQEGDEHQDVRRVEGYSKPFYEFWNNLGRPDFRVISKVYPKAFVRGCYDSEGGLYEVGETGRYRISMKNNSKWLLDICKDRIEEETNTVVKGPQKSETCFEIRIFRQDSIKEFCDWVQPTIERKDLN